MIEKKLLEDIKRIIASEKNNDDTVICLYDVLMLLEIKYWEYRNIIHQFENEIYYNWKGYYWMATNPFWAVFDYANNKLKICFSEKEFSYIKQENDVVLTSDSLLGKEILTESRSAISTFYDACLNYSDFNTQRSKKIKTVNSAFLVNIGKEGADVFLKNGDFKLKYRCRHIHSSKYEYNCESFNIIDVLCNREEAFFKRIFVKIEDCPEWTQSLLKEIREKELLKEKKFALVKRLFTFKKK